MSKIISIDFGKKRTGIAITDELLITANGLETIESDRIYTYLKQFFKDEDVDTIVVGYPLNLDMTATDSTAMVDELLIKLKKKFPTKKIRTVDERYTSKIAFQTMIDSGISKKRRRDKALIDKISATIILQSYLETIKY